MFDEPILSIGVHRSGESAGSIDYCIHVAAVRRVLAAGRLPELLACLEAVKRSATFRRALADQEFLEALGASNGG